MEPKRASTPTVEFEFDGRLLRARFKEGAEVTGHDAREHIAVMSQLTQGHPVPVMVDLRAARSQTREARETYGGPESVTHTRCCALVVASPISRVLGGFFLGLNKPRYPTRMFTSPEEAEQWLLSYQAPTA